jgi:hypothetical protein
MWTIIWTPFVQTESDYKLHLKFGIEIEKWIWPHKELPPRGCVSVDYRWLGKEGL